MSVDEAATSVSQGSGLSFQLLFFPSCSHARWQGQARLSALEAMGRITNAKALITPGPRASRDAAGGEMRDAILLYLGIKKRAGEECSIFGSVFW